MPTQNEGDEYIFTDEQDEINLLLPVNFIREDHETHTPEEVPPHLEDFAVFCERLKKQKEEAVTDKTPEELPRLPLRHKRDQSDDEPDFGSGTDDEQYSPLKKRRTVWDLLAPPEEVAHACPSYDGSNVVDPETCVCGSCGKVLAQGFAICPECQGPLTE